MFTIWDGFEVSERLNVKLRFQLLRSSCLEAFASNVYSARESLYVRPSACAKFSQAVFGSHKNGVELSMVT